MRTQYFIKLPSLTTVVTRVLFVFILLAVTPAFAQGLGGMGGMGMGLAGGGGAMPVLSPLEKLKQRLQSAKTEEARKKSLAKIKALLSKQYDTFLQTNEVELRMMENRVKKLRTQHERRKSAKTQLLDLELQRISNEATGLVWPVEEENYGMGMGGMGMGPGYYGPGSMDDTTDDDMGDSAGTSAMNQLREIALAFHGYESENKSFPGNIQGADDKALLSWRVTLLQNLGVKEQELYKKFRLDEPWDSKHNIQLLNEIPDAYKSLTFDSDSKTVCLGFDGVGAMFEQGQKLAFANITDGSSNTILVTQANRQSAIEWTKPADIPFEPGTAVTQLAELDGNFVFARCDGSAETIPIEKVDAKTLEHFIQRNDGNDVKF